MIEPKDVAAHGTTLRVRNLRERVWVAMAIPPVMGDCPVRIDQKHMAEPLAVRKARSTALKLASLPTDLWEGQLFAGSHAFENPRLHFEPGEPGREFNGLPDYSTEQERAAAAEKGLSILSVFGHIVPDYPRLLEKGLRGIMADAEAQRPYATSAGEQAFLDSIMIELQAVIDLAERLATRCDQDADICLDSLRAAELRLMADNLRQVPAGPAKTFWQALQSVWLLHMVFHVTRNGNALGRLDQYAWPYLCDDLESGTLNLERAAELVDCFCLKFNERTKATEDQLPEARVGTSLSQERRKPGSTSSQLGSQRDLMDATNHWLQNIVVGGLTPNGEDGTNLLSYLLLESFRRNEMTNPLMTVRLHNGSPEDLVRYACEVLKDGGGMPAVFNDEQIIPALEQLGIARGDALDYTNDGCWETIIPGRTDFRFQRLSLMLCIEWALNHGISRFDGKKGGVDTGDPREFSSYEQLWQAVVTQIDAMVERVERNVVESINNRVAIAPQPLLSALIEGAIPARRDMTAGGAKYRTYGMLAESAAYAIDSLTAIKKVIFEDRQATMIDLCNALDSNYEGYDELRAKLLAAPKYGNADDEADSVGCALINAYAEAVARHAKRYRELIKFPAGVGTFGWYIGIGEGLGPSPDGRLSGEPVASNFSPALGRDKNGIPNAILSYAKMHNCNLPAGGPLDLRLNRNLVEGSAGTDRMAALVRTFVHSGGNMMTLTVVDTKELRAAQQEPENYRSLRVRMGGWCAYFTMLSHEQQEHHIRRQESQQ